MKAQHSYTDENRRKNVIISMREKEQGRDTAPSKQQQEESELKLTSTKTMTETGKQDKIFKCWKKITENL